MHPNLNAELARRNLKVDDVQRAIGRSAKTTRAKMSGKSAFTLPEAIKLRDELLPGLSLEYLYGAAERNSA